MQGTVILLEIFKPIPMRCKLHGCTLNGNIQADPSALQAARLYSLGVFKQIQDSYDFGDLAQIRLCSGSDAADPALIRL